MNESQLLFGIAIIRYRFSQIEWFLLSYISGYTANELAI
jgi:hypothetical protein